MGISQSRAHSQGHQRPQWAAHIPRLPLQCLSPSKALQNVRCRNQGPLPPDWSLGRGSRRRNSTDNELGTNQCFQQGQPLTKARQRLQVSGTHASYRKRAAIQGLGTWDAGRSSPAWCGQHRSSLAQNMVASKAAGAAATPAAPGD